MCIWVAIGVWMPHCAHQIEWRHERHALAGARRPIFCTQLIKLFPGAPSLYFIALSLANAPKNEAARVIQRLTTDGTSPATVVPWYADGDVMGGQLPSSVSKVLHGFLFSLARP
jgi:hypothetical protein